MKKKESEKKRLQGLKRKEQVWPQKRNLNTLLRSEIRLSKKLLKQRWATAKLDADTCTQKLRSCRSKNFFGGKKRREKVQMSNSQTNLERNAPKILKEWTVLKKQNGIEAFQMQA